MSLTAGSRLGPYEILAPLGAGAMGEVYRARDPRLNREVAIKVLPASFSADPDRLRRFEQEAKAAGVLNHPNITSVYDIGTHENAPYVVQELLEGQTLRAELAGGRFSPRKAIDCALQITQGLAAAHDKGIVHRDLKPENLFVTKEGRVKILDFGLAKLTQVDQSGSATNLSTVTPGTEPGVVMGTLGYMSPEQVKGRPADARSDIFSFGAILHEMLSGKRAFHADSAGETMAAILKEDPPDLSVTDENISPGLERIIRHCLEKNPERRFQSSSDIAFALESLSGLSPPTSTPAHDPRRRWRILPLAAGLLLLGGLIGGLAARALRTPAEAAPRFALRRLTELPGPELHPDLSPDGRSLVYTSAAGGNRDVYLLRVGGDRAINLTAGSLADDEQAAISPDGETIVFHSGRDGGGLFLMGLTGESVRRLTADGYDPAWSPDGRFLAYATEPVRDPYSRELISEMWTVEVATGRRARLLPGDAVQPTWSPRGDRIAYWANTAGQRDIWMVPAGGGAPVPVTQDAPTDWSPEWSPDGQWLYFSSDRGGGMDLWRIRIDAVAGRGRGEPERVTSGARSLGGARFSADGRRLTVMAYDRTADLTLYEVAPGAKTSLRPLATLRPRSAHWCAPSPDAGWLACATIGVPEDLVVLRADGSELRRLTNDDHKDRVAIWSPDGETIAFYSTRGGEWDYWGIRFDGSGLRQMTSFAEVNFAVWSPSGREMVVSAHYKDFWRIDAGRLADARSARRLTPPKDAPRFEPLAWSPVGDRLAGGEPDEKRALETRALGIWDLKTGAFRRLDVPPAGRTFGAVAGWLADGRHFIARSRDGIALVDADTGSSRVLGPCAPSDYLRATPDGRVLLVEREVLDSDVWMLEKP